MEVYQLGGDLPHYQELARGLGELLWTAVPGPGPRLVKVYDEVDDDARHVGIGTDLDGGFDSRYGAIDSLDELKTVAAKLRLHFNKTQVEGIMGNNWLDFLSRSLPQPASRS